jgi:hypothetical protein
VSPESAPTMACAFRPRAAATSSTPRFIAEIRARAPNPAANPLGVNRSRFVRHAHGTGADATCPSKISSCRLTRSVVARSAARRRTTIAELSDELLSCRDESSRCGPRVAPSMPTELPPARRQLGRPR